MWQKGDLTLDLPLSGKYVITCARYILICIFRFVNIYSMCTGLGWDKDGDTLALICDRSSVVFLWDANSHRKSQVDSGFKDALSYLLWSKTAPQLAIGTIKGNLLIYNHQTSRYYSWTLFIRLPVIRISLLSGCDLTTVYCLFFIRLHIKYCLKQKQSGWIYVLFHSIYPFYGNNNLLYKYST